MSKHLRDDQISLRIPRPLRQTLEEGAQAEGSRITAHIRKILWRHEVARLTGRPDDRSSGEAA
jgi:hypothetical protein